MFTKIPNLKSYLIIAGIAVAIFLLIFISTKVANNRAITLEEQITQASSAIEVQEKKRIDLVKNLVDTTLAYGKYEQETLVQVTEARNSLNTVGPGNSQVTGGEATAAITLVNAVAEAYPELKADQAYIRVMTELSIIENSIVAARDDYNIQVRTYNKYVRTWPATMFLGMTGYEKLDFKYLEFNAPSDAPQNLYGGK